MTGKLFPVHTLNKHQGKFSLKIARPRFSQFVERTALQILSYAILPPGSGLLRGEIS